LPPPSRLAASLNGILHCSLGRELFLLQSCYSRGLLVGANSCRVELTSSARIILVSLRSPCRESILNSLHWFKKEYQIFLIYKEIQNGTVAKSYMTYGLLISREIFARFLIY
jgi:hypothetical protein